MTVAQFGFGLPISIEQNLLQSLQWVLKLFIPTRRRSARSGSHGESHCGSPGFAQRGDPSQAAEAGLGGEQDRFPVAGNARSEHATTVKSGLGHSAASEHCWHLC